MRVAGPLTLLIAVSLLFGIPVVRAAETASITAISDDGAYIALDDGTKWIVSAPDRSTVSTWVVGDDVVYIDNSKNCSNIEIINTDEDGDEACVKPVGN